MNVSFRSRLVFDSQVMTSFQIVFNATVNHRDANIHLGLDMCLLGQSSESSQQNVCSTSSDHSQESGKS